MDIKTTLIYPGIAGYGFASVGRGMEAGWISHGLAHLSAAAKAEGFQIDLVDLRALQSWDHFRSEIVARKPDVIGITMMSVDYNPAMRCIDIAKQVDPNVIVVVGGPHPTLEPDEGVARGACSLDTNFGKIEVDLHARWEAIAACLHDEMAGSRTRVPDDE